MKICKYSDICTNKDKCILCNYLSLFEMDEQSFTCYECAGSRDCDKAYDLYNLDKRCYIMDK